MDIEFTLVRLKRTKEPVAFFERVDDIIELCQKIDFICSPADCEYADCPVDLPFSLYFPMKKEKGVDDAEIVGAAVVSDIMAEAMVDAFDDPDNQWTSFPDGMSVGATDIDSAFPAPRMPF